LNEDTLTKLFEYNRQTAKDLSLIESALNAHLESSVVRVEGYDKDIYSVKESIVDLKKRVDQIESFILDFKGQKAGEEKLKSLLKNVLGIILTLVGILLSWLAIRK
jgi:tetrahydromethanopterin S-methyltransferase subunit G